MEQYFIILKINGVSISLGIAFNDWKDFMHAVAKFPGGTRRILSKDFIRNSYQWMFELQESVPTVCDRVADEFGSSKLKMELCLSAYD